MLKTTIEEKPWVLVKFAQALVCPLGTVGILFGVTAIAGYVSAIEELYRPITDGAATNPLTAICMILIGFAIRNRNNHKYERWLSRLLAFLVMIVISTLFVDTVSDSNISALITPFQHQVQLDLQMGKAMIWGANLPPCFFSLLLA
ncbi:hypothetical protein Ping_2275 [Psychromonas ingrahamii 37]|uniref:Uncharacterized protein n=1 Tax=Psychromonas ingrahamii (strain DSM 17664 / CCUG 51855 / 37) TaxID=357804 RepID=A1SX01_PSYIN|nr:hypothetical protein [Psychromonas ingrahamii]ABM04016.1 hypothetical protein Ping_2275 [Psychromonas ingrahamii 37]